MTNSNAPSGRSLSFLPRTLLVLASLLLALPALAADERDAEAEFEVEIDRDAADLKDEIRPRPVDTDVADTVLTFTNVSSEKVAKIKCQARNRAGEVMGNLRVVIQPNAVKYVLASDFSDGRDFVGHAVCRAKRSVLPAAIFLGPDITDLPTHKRKGTYRFPLIATY